MSEIAQEATVTIHMADFAQAEPSGKANVVGSGLTVLNHAANKRTTARFSLVVETELPYPMLPQDFSVEVALVDTNDELVAPTNGQPLRVAQVASIERPQMPNGVSYPRETLRGRARLIVDFAGGLPLPAGQAYRWRVRLDGDDSIEWDYPFAVAGPVATGSGGPVIG